MNTTLQADNLLQTTGYTVVSSNGEYLGKIMKVTRNEADKCIEYLILQSRGFLDRKERFFAIPASSAFIKLAGSKNIILQLSKDALHFAKRIAANKCPKPDFKNNSPLYELI